MLPPRPKNSSQIFLIVAIRVAYYVPLPFFSVQQPKSQNVLDLFMPVDFGDFSGAPPPLLPRAGSLCFPALLVFSSDPMCCPKP